MKPPVTAAQVARFCDLLTNRKNIADFEGSRNGLQHKGTRPVRKVGAAVDAGAEVFAAAARRGVDFLIVHHGMYWRPVSPEREVRALRKAALKKTGLSLYSSHLPLDAHPAIGNNALIAQDLGLKVVDWFVDYEGLPIACICQGIPRATLRKRQGLLPAELQGHRIRRRQSEEDRHPQRQRTQRARPPEGRRLRHAHHRRAARRTFQRSARARLEPLPLRSLRDRDLGREGPRLRGGRGVRREVGIHPDR